jgi:glycosyltransferase involved in cell wall biosynthesis
MKSRIAIVHPLLKANQIGGGERVNLDIATHFDADIFVVSSDTTWWNEHNTDPFVPLFLSRVVMVGAKESGTPGVKKLAREWAMRGLSRGVFADRLNAYDVVIFGDDIRYLPQMITKPHTLYYRHTLLSSGFSGIFNGQTVAAMRACDTIISNSHYSAKTLSGQYGLDSHVIAPPVDISQCTNNGDEGYFLYAARLETQKGIRETVTFFAAHPQYELKIVGDGSQKAWLQEYLVSHATPNIHFLGTVGRDEYFDLLSRCHSFVALYEHEAFGISPVEAMASGKPIIALDSGALPEIVIHKQNGYIVPDRAAKNVLGAIQWIDGQYPAFAAKNAASTAPFVATRFFSQLLDVAHLPAQTRDE